MNGKFTSVEEIRDRGNFSDDTKIFKKYNIKKEEVKNDRKCFQQISSKGKNEVNSGRIVCNIPGMFSSECSSKINSVQIPNETMGISCNPETDKRICSGNSGESNTSGKKEICGSSGRITKSISGTGCNQRCSNYCSARVLLVKKKNDLGLKGVLIGHYPIEIKKQVVTVIQEAISFGMTQTKACNIFGITQRKFRRWLKGKNMGIKKQRIAWNKLTELEHQSIINASYEPELLGKPLSHIYVWGIDSKRFCASLTTVYRVLAKAGLVKPIIRKRKKRNVYVSIHELLDQGFSIICYDGSMFLTDTGMQVWGIPVLLLPCRYLFYIGYAIGSVSAVDIIRVVHEAIENIPDNIWESLIAHSDRGSAMKAKKTKQSIENDLGIPIHFGRPHTPSDQAWIESFIKTLKYHRDIPFGFPQVADIVNWFRKFHDIYNNEPHSSLKYVTPTQAFAGKMEVILRQRKHNLLEARKARLDNYYASKNLTTEVIGCLS